MAHKLYQNIYSLKGLFEILLHSQWKSKRCFAKNILSKQESW